MRTVHSTFGREGSDRDGRDARGPVVVVGSGVAGLSAALALAPHPVVLVTKTDLGGGASRWAQGGIAAAVGPGDRPDLHAQDTLGAGAGLCDPAIVDAVTSEGPERIDHLLELGAIFDRDERGHLRLGREGAHGRRRVLHADGDATGAEIVRVLVDAVLQAPHVRVLERTFAEDLVFAAGPSESRRVRGLRVRLGSTSGPVTEIPASAIVLATGGFGQLYLHTTNPVEATGDGLAMAARAGAVLADLEMVQFHPTALAVDVDPRPLVTEALRGEGAVLRDGEGRRFMVDVDPRAELAPRDIVAREIWSLAQRGQVAMLDATEVIGDDFPDRFPTVWASCVDNGLDPRVEPIPVTPAAHYAMAGVATDGRGRTSLDGLWACGEVSSTGLHGANRLASNSLLEGLVLGARVGADVLEDRALRGEASQMTSLGRPATFWADIQQELEAWMVEAASIEGWDAPGEGDLRTSEIRRRLRKRMWESVGLVRDEVGLRRALEEIESLEAVAPPVGETANLVLLGRMVCAAALARVESRGAHYRQDHQQTSSDWSRRLFWRLAEETGTVLDPVADRTLLEGADRRAIA